MKTQDHLLEVQELQTYFYTFDGVAKAVDDVSLFLDKGEVLGVVGESVAEAFKRFISIVLPTQSILVYYRHFPFHFREAFCLTQNFHFHMFDQLYHKY